MRKRRRRTLRADPFGGGGGAGDIVRAVNAACRAHRREDGALTPHGKTAERLRRRYYTPPSSPGTCVCTVAAIVCTRREYGRPGAGMRA